jgi:TolB-like protein
LLFVFENHVLDPERRQLRRAGEAVTLEPQVFDLILYLIQNRVRVVSKDDLIRDIWGGRIVSESAVTTRLNAARKAIGDNGAAQRLIRTVPRRGVRFVADVHETGVEGDVEAHRGPFDTVPAAHSGKPSVIVLPFADWHSLQEQAHFGDGLTEDLITELSRNRLLFVIAQGTSLSFKDRPADMKAITAELGVRYVVSGTVRRNADRVRITAQLTDAETGGQIWATQLDRNLRLDDIFAVQDDIARAVITAIDPAISRAEQSRALRKPPGNLSAWEAWHRSLWHFMKNDRPGAVEFAERAIALDPHFAPAYAFHARLLLLQATLGHGPSLVEALAKAEVAARTAVGLDADCAIAHAALAWVFDCKGYKDAALEEADLAIALNANDPWGYLEKGRNLVFSGEPARAHDLLATAFRLDPLGPTAFAATQMSAFALYFQQDYEAAAAMAVRSIRVSPQLRSRPRIFLAAALGQLGRVCEARTELQAAIAISPGHFKTMTEACPFYFRAEDHRHLLAGLRKAGWQR